MKIVKVILVMMLLFTTSGFAQELKFPELKQLAARATEVVDVTMDRQMLDFAAKFLNDRDSEDAEARNLIRNLKGIYVKSYEFDKEGAYSLSDVEPFRTQLKAPVWSRMLQTQSKDENVEIYFKNENGVIGGMAIISAEPMELTLIHIDGPLNPDQLGSLGGKFGIPKVGVKSQPASNAAKPAVKK